MKRIAISFLAASLLSGCADFINGVAQGMNQQQTQWNAMTPQQRCAAQYQTQVRNNYLGNAQAFEVIKTNYNICMDQTRY